MPYSEQLYDTEFNVAHLLKKASYIAVLTGLLISLSLTYQELRAETEKRTLAEQQALQQAEALSKSEKWFRAVANHTHDWEYWVAPDGQMLFVSPSCERVTGYSAEAFLSGAITIETIVSAKEPESILQHFSEINNQAHMHDFDFRIETSSGEERWINHACLAIYDETGQFIGRRASNRDITERKLIEFETLTLSKALHYSPAAVIITNANGDIEYTNPKFTEITGYSAEEMLGQNPRLLKSGNHEDAFYQQMWETLKTGATWTGEMINKRRNGEMYWESTSISPILDDENNIKRYVAVKQEITAKKQLEATLYHQANFDVLTG
jgi:PAS domain S-box-containing protein